LWDVKWSGYCVGVTQPDGWTADLARVIAGEVRHYRQQQGLSAQQLADRCAELGQPIQRSVLANLESGRRPTVTVAELLVLAAALSVAPVLLVFPVGRERESVFLPGKSVATWPAAQWFGGHGDFPAPDLRPEDSGPELRRKVGYRRPVELYERHQAAQRSWTDGNAKIHALQMRARTENGNLSEALQAREAEVAAIEDRLRDLREDMRAAGLITPVLRGELAYRLGEQADNGGDAG